MNLESVKSEARAYGVKWRRHADMPLPWRFSFWKGKVWADHTFMTLRPYIYLPDPIDDPWPYWRTIAHELVHWRQQKKSYPLMWMAKYAASQKFRWESEREAFLIDLFFGGDLLRITTALRDDYGIRCVSPGEMREWFANNKMSQA